MKTSNDANRNDLAQAYGDAGWTGLLAGRVTEAAAHLEAAQSINPDNRRNTVYLGHANLFLGRYDEAMRLYASVKDRTAPTTGSAPSASSSRTTLRCSGGST